MLFGVITCLVSVVLLGIDGQFVSPSVYPQVSQHNRIFILLQLKFRNVVTKEKKKKRENNNNNKKLILQEISHRSVSLISLEFSFFLFEGANSYSRKRIRKLFPKIIQQQLFGCCCIFGEKLNFEIFETNFCHSKSVSQVIGH